MHSYERTTTQVKDSLKRNTQEMVRLKALEDEIKQQVQTLREGIIEDMYDLGVSTYPTDKYTYSLVDDTISYKVNKKQLETDFPNVYKQVTEASVRAGGLRMVKVKQKGGK